jgi:metal transporter CNNM
MEANSDSSLSFMGQDQVYLQVVAESGSGNDRRDAQKVLNVLRRGRHWVLVSLLLSNVITNETLPIVLDQDAKGGWLAVLISTILIVIFGEILPQSICAKHGLAIGAWSSRQVYVFVSTNTFDPYSDMCSGLCMGCSPLLTR